MKENYGFDLIREEEVPEINSKVQLYRHVKTGAELMSVINKDENKVFGITFRTPPTDSTGLPHIMEHSVLCGSRKYPVKEPFVELIKGSLNTFLNAMTYPDKTCYPVASTNLQDFYNLVDVYLDAVLHPLINPYTLMQEGWHYEIPDPDGVMTFKGVVYNEMKGVYSSPDDILGDESQMALFPDTVYGHQSGGDPEAIPDLTWDQFKHFHDTYYHPSNARIYFYGDDDPQERLKILDAYLSEYEGIEIHSEIDLQKKFDTPFRKVIPYDSGEAGEKAKAYITVNWLMPEGKDPEQVLALGILDHILIGTPASPLRKVLIESGLGEDLTGRGMEKEYRQMAFSTGMRGVEIKNIDLVEGLIVETLKQIAENGIDGKTIEASINTLEFNLRENNTGPYPRGLAVMLRSLTAWLYDRDPIAPLAFEAPLTRIKEKIDSGERYFESLIQEHFIDNTHRMTVVLTPDPDLGRQRAERERARLAAARDRMSKDELEKIAHETAELMRRQETPDSPEALATIPSLSKEDLDPHVRVIPNEVVHVKPTLVLHHDLFTSDILYLDLGFNLQVLTAEKLPLMRLFARSLLEMGTESENFVELIQRIGRETGGIHYSLYTADKPDSDEIAAYLILRSKAMVGQTKSLLSILNDILLTANFDNKERFRQMVLEEKAGFEAGLIPSGHRVVNNRLKAQYSEAAWTTEQISGIDYLFFIRELAENLDSRWSEVLTTLEEIRRSLILQNNAVCNITLDDENWLNVRPEVEAFLHKLPEAKTEQKDWDFQRKTNNQGLTIPSQVNYVGKGANLYDLGYQQNGSINVITQYLRSTWLWEKVRVQGGAYGGFCTFDRLSGIFTYLSYRDPNLLETLENYDKTATFLKDLDISEEELTKSIIGAIGEIDSYQLPDAKGYTAMLRFILGVSDQERQRFRDEILETTQEDFHSFGKTLENLNQQGSIVVLGSSEKIQNANLQKEEFLEIRKIL